MIIRWLGAYGHKSPSLNDSLIWELTENRDEVCAEPISRGSWGKIDHAMVGLIVSHRAIVKKFTGDVWSIKKNGFLVKTRKPVDTHREVWVRPCFTGLIVKNYDNRSSELKDVLVRTSFKYSLRLLSINSHGEVRVICDGK